MVINLLAVESQRQEALVEEEYHEINFHGINF